MSCSVAEVGRGPALVSPSPKFPWPHLCVRPAFLTEMTWEKQKAIKLQYLKHRVLATRWGYSTVYSFGNKTHSWVFPLADSWLLARPGFNITSKTPVVMFSPRVINYPGFLRTALVLAMKVSRPRQLLHPGPPGWLITQLILFFL